MKQYLRINPVFFFLSFLLPVSMIGIGVLMMVVLVIIPYTNFRVSTMMASPVIPSEIRNGLGFEDFKFAELKESSLSAKIKNVPALFTLSIPTIGITSAKVETNSINLDPVKYLGHYRGTSLPGEKGNSLIYGHSVLPIFFNQKDYKTIFSTIPNLKKGDVFYINFGGEKLTYKVIEKINLKPSDINVFDPNPAKLQRESSTVTLMTCVPPGSKTYRMLVIGELTNRN